MEKGNKGAGKRKVWVVALASLIVMAGCSVRVHKDNHGEDKDVAIQTPFGGMQVHKNKADAAELGLPAYPGAILDPGEKGNDKSVDLQMGFGPMQMHVQVVSYTTSDPQAKVQEFYRKALGRYGAVLTCHGNENVGMPARTGEGLSCKDHNSGKSINVDSDASIELKTGSEHKQHIVAFEEKGGPGTHFSLIALALPSTDESSGSSREE